MRYRLSLVPVLWLLSMTAAASSSVVAGLTVEASTTPANTLVISVRNDSKIGNRGLEGIDVYLGGSEAAPRCKASLPAVRVNPGEMRRVEVAAVKDLSRCMGWQIQSTVEQTRRQLRLVEEPRPIAPVELPARADQRLAVPTSDVVRADDARLVRIVVRARGQGDRQSETAIRLHLR